MSGTNDRKREERAFDALIVSQLRRERDIKDLNDLPELTEEELAAMNSIPDNLIERLWEEECEKTDDAEEECESDWTLAGVGTGDESYSGLNRAQDMGDEDQETLDQSRNEAIEELKKRLQKPKDGVDGKDA